MSSLRRLLRLVALELVTLPRQRLAQATVLVPALAAAAIPFAVAPAGAGPAAFLALGRSLELSFLVFTFLVLLRSAASFSAEVSERTLRNVLAGPFRRGEVFLARWCALELEMLLALALLVAAAMSTSALRHDFGDITADAVTPLFYADEVARFLTRGVVYLVPACAALVAIGLLVSTVCASPATAAGCALALLLGLDVVKSLFAAHAPARELLLNAYLPTLFDRTSYILGAADTAEGISDSLWLDDDPRHLLVFLVPAIYLATALVAGGLAFVRRDFTE